MNELTQQDLEMIIDSLEQTIKQQHRALNSKTTLSPQFKPIYEKIIHDLQRIKIIVTKAHDKK